jgi:hypothetical protein
VGALVLSNGDKRDECNLAFDSEEAFDKWIWQNCEVDDRAYEGDSDGHRHTGKVSIYGLLIGVSPIPLH